jgi:hypothetical protein
MYDGTFLTPKHYTVKEGYRFSRPQQVSNQTHLRGIIKFFPARESLVGDIPAGDGKIVNLFLQCMQHTLCNKHLESFAFLDLSDRVYNQY